MSHYNAMLLKAVVVGWLVFFGYAGQTAAQTLLPNGDFETGNLTGWTPGGVNGGIAVVVQEGTCFSANNTLGLTLNGNYAVTVRSSGPAPTNSIGIVTSDPFVAGAGISFRALSENDPAAPVPNPVTLEVRVLDGVGSVLHSQIVQTNIVTLNTGFTTGCQGAPVDGSFSTHILDTSAFAGQTIRLEFRQHTNVSGKGFFTLLDDITLTPLPPPPSLTAITVSPPQATINTGATQQFSATGTFSNGAQQTLSGASSWSLLSAAGAPPSERSGHSAVYDAANNRMMVFGGSNSPSFGCTGFASGSTFFNDTWVLNNANGQAGATSWTGLMINTAPPARWRHSSVYDAVNNRLIVFGGEDVNGFRQDVWVLTNANGSGGAPAWQQLSPSGTPPGGRTCHAAVYDAQSNRMIIFAGIKAAGEVAGSDVWVLTHANGLGGTPQWQQLLPAGTAPEPRIFPSAVYDQAANRMMVSGGGQGAGLSGLADTWVLTNANGTETSTPVWSRLPDGPARAGHSSVYDAATNHMLVFGGCDATCVFKNDVWLLSNANNTSAVNPVWTQRSITGAPPAARTAHSAVYDTASNRMIMFGGCDSPGCPANDVWLLDNANGGVDWSSSNMGVASINANGLASGLTGGNSVITARNGGVSGTATLTVVSPDAIAPVTTASVTPPVNAHGWHKTDVNVTLNATDNPGGSGVQEVSYSLSGAQSGAGTVAGGTATFTITAEGVTTVSYFARDNAGNVEAAKDFVVRIDKTAPVVTLPPDQTVEATSPAGAIATFDFSASDGLSGVDTLASSAASGDTFPLGVTPVQVTATDKAGNTASASFSITVQDTTPPEAVFPPEVVVEATSPDGAIVHYTVTATDLVDQAPVIEFERPPGSVFGIGSSIARCHVYDRFGNRRTIEIIIIVKDTTPPTATLTLSPDTLWSPDHKLVAITPALIASDTAGPVTVSLPAATSSEPINGTGDGDTDPDWVVSGTYDLQLRAERGGTGSGRIYTVSYTVTDQAGNTTVVSATVSVPHSQ